MILTTPKTWADIKTAIQNWNLHRVIVVSCGGCAAGCGTGGTEGSEKLITSLETLNLEILASVVIPEPCDSRNIPRDFRYISQELEKADGLIVASCGIGAQTIANYSNKPTIVTTDTIMMSETVRLGQYINRCEACGHCILNETGGICPISLCAKSMLNGPCGGMTQGKCEVDYPNHDCVWTLIYNRLQKLNQQRNLAKIRPPQDWELRRHQSLDISKRRQNYYHCQENERS